MESSSCFPTSLSCLNLRRRRRKSLAIRSMAKAPRRNWDMDAESTERKRFDSLESWSMILNKKEPYSLSTETILRLALDISRGMEYLHSQGVIHRDLKSNNLLLNDEMRVKVADFGTSCLETQCQETKGNMGTYRWMAPEMIKEKPYTRKVDVYSFGIVLWELTTALLPFQGMTPVQAAFAVAEKNARPPLPASCQPALAHLIKRCWAANPNKRPDFSYIVAALEEYDECVKEGLPLVSRRRLVRRNANAIAHRFKTCITLNSPPSSIPLVKPSKSSKIQPLLRSKVCAL